MKKLKKALCLLLCAAVCFSLLAACAEAPQQDQPPVPDTGTLVEAGETGAAVDADHALGLPGLRADGELQQLLQDIEYYRHALGGGVLWAWGKARGTQDRAIASVPLDGSVGQVLTLHFPASDEQRRIITPEEEARGVISVSVGYDPTDSAGEYPMLVRSRVCFTGEPGKEVWEKENLWLCTVDAQGNVSEGVPIAQDVNGEETDAAASFACWGVSGGTFWGCTQKMNEQTKTIDSLELQGYDAADGALKAQYSFPPLFSFVDLYPLNDSTVLVLGYAREQEDGKFLNGDDRCVLVVEFAQGKGKLLQTVELPDSIRLNAYMCCFARSVQPGPVWLLGSRGLYLWDLEENTFTLKHDIQDVGMTQNLPNRVYAVNEDTFYLTSGSMKVVGQDKLKQVFEVWLLGEDVTLPADERPVVTVGAFAFNKAAVHTAVQSFNKISADLRAEMITYTDADAKAAGLESAQELLNRDILQGTAPDVITGLYGADLRQLVGKGAIMDLYPMLDADAELSREDFAAGPLSAGTVDGGLYGIITEYSILTTVGSAGKLGEETGWSMDEFAALTAGMPTPYYGFGRDTLLWYQFQAGADRYIDYAAGKAHLDTPEFAAMLEGFAAYPETMGYFLTQDLKPLFDGGQAAAAVCFIMDFSTVKDQVYTFNGPVVYKGFAGAAGSGSLLAPGLQLSVCASSPRTDAAWRFVRYFLSAEYQFDLTVALPLRRDALAAAAQEAQEPYLDLNTEDGILYCIPSYLDQRTTNQNIIDYWTRGLTPEETDKIVALAEATSVPFLYDDVVMGILTEEASAFFAGARTAADAAAIMQNRIQTYLDEQG